MSAPNDSEAALPPPPLPPLPPERPITEARPEILVGAALAGGFVLAKLLGRRGR